LTGAAAPGAAHALARAGRLVVKVGSALLLDADGAPDARFMASLAARLFHRDPPIAFLLADPLDELGDLGVAGEVIQGVVRRFEFLLA